MTGLRRKLDLALKVQVVLEAIRGKRTITEIASEYGVHPNENYCLEKAYEEDKEALLRKIGQLEMERDWLQKKLNSFQVKRGKGL